MLQFPGLSLRPVPVLHAGSATHRVLALDASLSATGVALYAGGQLNVGVLSPPGKLRGAARLEWFHDRLSALLTRNEPEAVILEGYAYGASNQREAIGELGGVIRLLLAQHRIRYYVASPNTLKLFATGRAKVEKSVVSKELFKRYGIDLNENNEVDAAALALIALAKVGGYVVMTKAQQGAIAKIE